MNEQVLMSFADELEKIAKVQRLVQRIERIKTAQEQEHPYAYTGSIPPYGKVVDRLKNIPGVGKYVDKNVNPMTYMPDPQYKHRPHVTDKDKLKLWAKRMLVTGAGAGLGFGIGSLIAPKLENWIVNKAPESKYLMSQIPPSAAARLPVNAVKVLSYALPMTLLAGAGLKLLADMRQAHKADQLDALEKQNAERARIRELGNLGRAAPSTAT